MTIKNRKLYITWLSRGFFGLGVVVLVVGLIVTFHQNKTYHQAVVQAAKDPATPQVNKPTPSEFDTYTVSADAPRYLFIPKLNVRAIVRRVGLTKDGAIGTPSNINDTAWYSGSSKPGQTGATLIDGHISSWTAKGVFYKLSSLKAGDAIQIQLGDGSLINYTVAHTQLYDATAVDSAAMLNPIDPAKHSLNLITCAGDVIAGTNDFNKRLIVSASQS